MTDTTKRLGYGGSATIAGVQVLITGGSFDESGDVSYLQMVDIPPSMTQRSNVKHADGVRGFSGSLSFDMTTAVLGLFNTNALLMRFYKFNVGIHDGENQYFMSDCQLSNLSITGEAGGLLNSTIAFSAVDGKQVGAVENKFIRDCEGDGEGCLIGYWWSGNTDVKSWTFTMSQDVQAVYANKNVTDFTSLASKPLYLRVGLVSFVLDVTTYSPLNHSEIRIATSAFTLSGDTTATGYSFGGQTALGDYSHTFTTSADAGDGSDDQSVLIT